MLRRLSDDHAELADDDPVDHRLAVGLQIHPELEPDVGQRVPRT
jgi:hypothetical protein